jgi:hypothetical protein
VGNGSTCTSSQLATSAPDDEICTEGSCSERTSSEGPSGSAASAPARRVYACRTFEFAETNSEPSAAATPAIVERFTASGSIGDSRVSDDASAGR